MPRYAETQKLLERDLSQVSPDSAVKNIEMWEESLSGLDSKEGKALSRDLEALRKELGKDKPNGERIQSLMQKLGEQTVALAGEASDASGEKLRGIGEALSNAKAGGGEEEADEVEEEADDDEGASGGKKRVRAKSDS